VFAGHVEDQASRPDGTAQIGHLLEESSCMMRYCCADKRAFSMPLTEGAPQGENNDQFGAEGARFVKPCSFPITCIIPATQYSPECDTPCCCLLPQVQTFVGEEKVGSSHYACDACLWVPKFMVRDANGADAYYIAPDTCCFGACMTCKCSGGRGASSLYTPFYIRDPVTKEKMKGNVQYGGDNADAQIKKVWSGMKKECCSDADNFQILFPAGIDTNTKTNLLGTTVLVDFSHFETHA
jgi:hypothetical protein